MMIVTTDVGDESTCLCLFKVVYPSLTSSFFSLYNPIVLYRILVLYPGRFFYWLWTPFSLLMMLLYYEEEGYSKQKASCVVDPALSLMLGN